MVEKIETKIIDPEEEKRLERKQISRFYYLKDIEYYREYGRVRMMKKKLGFLDDQNIDDKTQILKIHETLESLNDKIRIVKDLLKEKELKIQNETKPKVVLKIIQKAF